MGTIVITGPRGGLGTTALDVLRHGGYRVRVVEGREAALAVIAAERPVVVLDVTGLGSEDGAIEAAWDAEAIAATACGVGAASVVLSSSTVFDGSDLSVHVESDDPRPTTPAGRAMLSAERAVAAANPHHLIARASWTYGAGFPDFTAAIVGAADAPRGAVGADAGPEGTPTYVPHLTHALLRVLRAPAYGIFHVSGAGSCTRAQFARALRGALGLPPAAVVAAEAPGRPLALGSRRDPPLQLPDWRIGVKAYAKSIVG